MIQKDNLIKKWLENTLNEEEKGSLIATGELSELDRLDKSIQQFGVSLTYNEEEFEQIENAISLQKRKRVRKLFKIPAIAATLLVGLLTTYFIFSTNNYQAVIHKTINAESKTIILPDSSLLQMSVASSIQFYPNQWENNRNLSLEGEAFFEVKKGSDFTVKTVLGSVTVIGTSFNIEQRGTRMIVQCFSGIVEVKNENSAIHLKKGEQATLSKKTFFKSLFNQDKPDWLAGTSTFESVPFSKVIKDFERTYDITIDYPIDYKNKLFTGVFQHNDMKIAMAAVTLPFQLKYQFNNDQTVSIHKE